LKLSIIRKNGAISGYSIAFNKSEVEAAGLVDADGNSLELDKFVDPEKGTITVAKAKGGVARKTISNVLVTENIDLLQKGGRVRSARGVHYTMKDNIVYRQAHQDYLREKEPEAYAELQYGILYEVI